MEKARQKELYERSLLPPEEKKKIEDEERK
jgi:hypothetical protein